MKKIINIWRTIVGPECGFAEEGNELWYYTVALVIDIMLNWWLNSQSALVFTILAVIHYLSIILYGYFCLCEIDGKSGNVLSFIYLTVHLALLIIGIITSFKWTLISIAIVLVAITLSPDDGGNNIFLQKVNVNSYLPLVFNCLIFVALVVIDFLLPIKLWIKIIIIIGALVVHPLIDSLEGECVHPYYVTFEILNRIRNCKKR